MLHKTPVTKTLSTCLLLEEEEDDDVLQTPTAPEGSTLSNNKKMEVQFAGGDFARRKASFCWFSSAKLLLFLQFAWIIPYICFANYLERCLLPFRLYCYTDPDLLSVQTPIRPNTTDCIRQIFGNNNRVNPNCSLNHPLLPLLVPPAEHLERARQVIAIRSAPRHGEYREYIRNSWKPYVAAKIGPVIFVSGRDSVDLREESARHGDILQLDFEDSYQNLTLKMMGLYRYFIEQSGVREIIVINDDTIVNATSLLEVLNAPKNIQSSKYLIGKVSRAYPRLLFPWLPWYVSAATYPHKCYPPFVQGSSFIISRDAAVDVLAKICDFPHIHLDDIMMGVVTNCLNIRNYHRSGFDQHTLGWFRVFHYQFERYSAAYLQTLFDSVKNTL